MYLVDTNVVSELRRPSRTHPQVAAWADATPASAMFLSCITLLELDTGALMLGRRDPEQGALIRRWIDERVLPAFAGRILGIDTAVARRCAHFHVPDRKPYRDSLIAATAVVHDLIVVTRNRPDFAAMGVGVLNPWD
jgi:toxin FitB